MVYFFYGNILRPYPSFSFSSLLVRTLEDAETEASKMVGALTTAEFAHLLQRQTNSPVNRVHSGELPGRSIPSKAGDDDVGTSRKRKREVAKRGQVRTRRATKDTAESGGEEEEDDREAGSEDDGTHGYTPSPTPAKSGVGSCFGHAPSRRCCGDF